MEQEEAQSNPLLDMSTELDVPLPVDPEYSPRMDDIERKFKQLNRMVSSAEYDDLDDDHDNHSAKAIDDIEKGSDGSASVLFNPKRLDSEESVGNQQLVGSVTNEISINDTDDIDFEIWENTDIPKPPTLSDMPTFEGLPFDLERGESHDAMAASAGVEEYKQNRLVSSIPPYAQKFQQDADPVKMVISKIPEELLKSQHAQMENAAAKRRLDILNATKKRERGLLQREHLARARVEQMENDAQERLRQEGERRRLLEREREVDMGLKFRQAREEMEAHLAKKDSQLREVFGEVTTDQNLGRRFRVEWDLTPQPIEMRVHCLRAVKNKLPKGAYVLMLSQRDRLGGAPLMWSRLGAYGIGENHPATTRPVKHYGRYFDRTMKVEDSVYALCPPKNQIKPSNIFVMELFHLAGRSNPTDRVVAWTALPISNTHFTVVNGKFRLPMLRGELSPSIKHFRSMEALMADDLNAWLCNIYVEIRHIPRTMAVEGMQDAKTEYEIEFDFMSKLLNLRRQEEGDKKRASDAEASSGDDEEAFKRRSTVKYGGEVDLELFNRKLYRRRSRRASSTAHLTPGAELESSDVAVVGNPYGRPLLTETPRKRMLNAKGGGGAGGWWGGRATNKVAPIAENGSNELDEESPTGIRSKDKPLLELAKQTEERIARKLLGSSSEESSSEEEGDNKRVPKDILERGYDRGQEFFLQDHQKGKLSGIETLSTAKERQWAASGVERLVGDGSADTGRVLRKMHGDGLRLDSEAIRGAKGKKQKAEVDPDSWTAPLTDPKEFDLYSMSLTSDVAQQRRLLPDALVKSKLRYLYFEAFGDVLPAQWGTMDCYIGCVVFAMAFWLRMYIHYIGQFFFLQAFRTPVYAFDVRIYEIVFKYMSSSVPVSVEFGVVAVGPLGNVCVLFCMSMLASFFYKFASYLPDVISQFVAAYGIATILDPLMIFLVDVIMHNYSCGNVDKDCKDDYTSRSCDCFVGDFMKLWNRMKHDENSGMTGLLITLMVYICCSVMASLILYEYMINSHKNARILDIWRRVSAPAEEFFIPHDFEVSYEELSSIVARAKLWRGAQGSTRKVVVSEYEEKDPYDLEFSAITKHYAIYEHEMGGKRTLYRHFLMMPDGAVIEIFDQLSLDLSNQFKSLERLLGDSGGGRATSPVPFGNAKKVSLFAGLEKA